MAPEDFAAFMARFFPIFIVGLFSAVCGIALLSVLWGEVNLQGSDARAEFFIGLIVGLTLPLCIGNFIMIKGYSWAMWIIWAVMGISLAMSLSLLVSGMSVFLGIILLAQLLSLLALNSERHREMRARLVELRIERSKA